MSASIAQPGLGTRVPGSTVLGRYRLEESLGTGATSEVWRALDTESDSRVTLKLLREHLSADARAQAGFRGEAHLLARMPAGSVVPVRMLHDGSADWAIVFEDVAGETLAERIGRGPIPPREAAGIAADIARSLSEAHGIGLVHRDIKPGNLLLADDGTVRLLDFGIARELERAEGPATTTGMVVGTIPYLAPERLRGASATPATDVYALGVVLYEMLAGRRPGLIDGDGGSDPSDPSGGIDGVPDGLMAICRAMTSPDPRRRLGDAAQVADALRRWLSEGTVPAALADPALDGTARTTVVVAAIGPRSPWFRRASLLGGLSAACVALAVVASSVGLPRPAGPAAADLTGPVPTRPSSGTSHGASDPGEREPAADRAPSEEPQTAVIRQARDDGRTGSSPERSSEPEPSSGPTGSRGSGDGADGTDRSKGHGDGEGTDKGKHKGDDKDKGKDKGKDEGKDNDNDKGHGGGHGDGNGRGDGDDDDDEGEGGGGRGEG
jgi:serine/threonine-protein kinase